MIKAKLTQLPQNLLHCNRPNNVPKTIFPTASISVSQRTTIKEQLALGAHI